MVTQTITPKPIMTVSLGAFRIDGMEVSIDPAWNPLDSVCVRATMRVPAVADAFPYTAGQIIPVTAMAVVTDLTRTSKAERAKVIKSQILRLLEHEIEEHMMIDGEYAFDPHHTGRTKPKPAPKRIVWREPAPEPDKRARVAGRFPERSLVVPRQRGAYWPSYRGLRS